MLSDVSSSESTWVFLAVIAFVIACVVAKVRIGRITEFDRTPVQKAVVRVIDALAIAIVGVVVLAAAAFVVIALLAVPWPSLASRLLDGGGWVLVLAAVVLFGVTLWLTPAWFRPAHLRAMRDDEAPADDRGRRSPTTFDATGRTYPDLSKADPRDGS